MSGDTFDHISQDSIDTFDSNSYFATVDTGSVFPFVDLYIDASGGSLVGYGGGILYSANQRGDDGGDSFYRVGAGYTFLSRGALTLQAGTALPEPASLLLLPAGLAALAFARRRSAG